MKKRVLLLALQLQRDGFLDDDSLLRLADRINREGHTSRVLRKVLAPGQEADARGLCGGAELVVVPRAWNLKLIEALRAGLDPEASLIRLSGTGVRAELDPHFDHVLDDNGLLALLGGAQPAQAEWKRERASELRQRLPALTEEARRPTITVSEGDVATRTTLSGPSGGCPYLRDVREEETFGALGLDPEETQTKGCAFCLDNVGSYVVPSVEQVLGSWLEQLRTARSRHGPGKMELLLTDERPHEFLPALFQALLDEPQLAPIELLIKSRSDWLLQYADGPLSQAARLAEASGSVLHIYLMGFENFDEEHLRLFNKGYSVQTNLDAIDKLRVLEAQLGAGFEFRKYRAHGIVLFTPWTKPEALLTNARIMRETHFEELRSEAVKTRLRLYPRTPLYRLAEHDGLLVEHFEESRPDRAAEQGYDASAPWRFQDPRSEAIFVAASWLGQWERRLVDADVLEIATRFVLRWPGLAAAPEVAALALRYALASWGTSLMALVQGLGAAVMLDRELELLNAGHKDAVLKESVAEEDLEALLAAYQAMGLWAQSVSSHQKEPAAGRHVAGRSHHLVAVARDEAALAQAVEAQRAVEAGDDAAILTMGAQLGYPSCCTRRFADLEERGDNLENERAPFLLHPEASLNPAVHRVGRLRMISHHLCAPDCAASVAVAERGLALVEDFSAPAAQWIREQLLRPVLVLDYQRRYVLQGQFDGDRFGLESLHALSGERQLPAGLGDAVALTLEAQGVCFETKAGTHQRLRASRPLLTTPGQPLAPSAQRAIQPPAGPPLPALPAKVRVGARSCGYQLLELRTEQNAYVITLGREQERITLSAAFGAAQPKSVRYGRWSVSIEANCPFSPRAKAAIESVIRSLAR